MQLSHFPVKPLLMKSFKAGWQLLLVRTLDYSVEQVNTLLQPLWIITGFRYTPVNIKEKLTNESHCVILQQRAPAYVVLHRTRE